MVEIRDLVELCRPGIHEVRDQAVALSRQYGIAERLDVLLVLGLIGVLRPERRLDRGACGGQIVVPDGLRKRENAAADPDQLGKCNGSPQFAEYLERSRAEGE